IRRPEVRERRALDARPRRERTFAFLRARRLGQTLRLVGRSRLVGRRSWPFEPGWRPLALRRRRVHLEHSAIAGILWRDLLARGVLESGFRRAEKGARV